MTTKNIHNAMQQFHSSSNYFWASDRRIIIDRVRRPDLQAFHWHAAAEEDQDTDMKRRCAKAPNRCRACKLFADISEAEKGALGREKMNSYDREGIKELE
jgi:hypothetical protein